MKRAHADIFPLHVRAVPAQWRSTIYSDVLSCFLAVPAQLREQRLELAPPEAVAKCLAEISLTAPHLNHSCRCGPEHVTAVLPQAHWCLGAGEHRLVKPSLQPCMTLWKDGGFSLVLSMGSSSICSAVAPRANTTVCRMEKRFLRVPVAAFVLRLWSPLLWKRFDDPVTHSSVCSAPSDRGRTWGQGEALGPYSMLLGAALAACTFSFNKMN